jgi:hypothetical protein
MLLFVEQTPDEQLEAHLQRVAEAAQGIADALAHLNLTMQRAQFTILDHWPVEKRTPRSWEIEREALARDLDSWAG